MATNIEAYLPSKSFLKKVGFFILVLAIVFGTAELFKYLQHRQEIKDQALIQPLVDPLIVSDISSIDSNADGISDWKQNLQEAMGITPSADQDQTEEGPINETEQFARDLFATAATISQSGDLTVGGADTIAQQVTDRIASTTVENLFTEKDVIVVAPTAKNREAYAKSLINLLDSKYPLNIDNSVEIIQNSLNSGDSTQLSKLEPIISRYTNLIEAMKKLSVPENVKDGHLEFLNILGKARGSIQIMRNSFANPIPSMSVFINYPEILNQLIEYVGPFSTKLPYSTAAANQE